MKYYFGILFSVFLLFVLQSCESTVEKKVEVHLDQDSTTPVVVVAEKDTTELEKKLIAEGLIWMGSVDSTVMVDLKYSGTDNFMKEDVYGDFDRLYLQPDVAEKIRKAQLYLKEKDSTLSLLIYDGVRPRSIQQKMWDLVDLPIHEKGKFVSNPKNGSLHNYGAAVDVTIANASGAAIDMATPYDDASELAYPRMEQQFLAEGKITKEQIANRQLLRSVMQKAGFFGIATEWWHFNSCTRAVAAQKYRIIE